MSVAPGLILALEGERTQRFDGRREQLFDCRDGSIGRSEECDWVLGSEGVSRLHAVVRYLNGIYFIDHLPTNFDITGPNAIFTVITPDAFATMGIPLRSGRDFNDGDTYDAPFTAVINDTLARRSFPNEDPIGRMIFCGLDSDKAMKIVGVVGNVRQEGPGSEPEAEIYMPYLQHPQPATNLRVIVRTEMEPGVITAATLTGTSPSTSSARPWTRPWPSWPPSRP